MMRIADRRWRVILHPVLISGFLWLTAGPGVWPAETPVSVVPPAVMSVRIRQPARPIHIGTPFGLEITVAAGPAIRWFLPPVPRRQGPFTLRQVTVTSPAGSPRRRVFLLEIQAFQSGGLDVPQFPLQWSGPDGARQLLSYDVPGRIEVKSLFPAAGSFAPQPPRGGLIPPARGNWRWPAALGGVMAVLILAVWLLVRRRVRPGGAVAAPAAVSPSLGLDYFLKQFELLSRQAVSPGTEREIAARAVEVFREFLAWRFGAELHPCTTAEIIQLFNRRELAPAEFLSELELALDSGDVFRFSPESGADATLPQTFARLIRTLGAPPATEGNDAVPAIS